MYLNEKDVIIDLLCSASEYSKLIIKYDEKNSSLIKTEEGYKFFAFDLIYGTTTGYITATINLENEHVIKSTMDLKFSKTISNTDNSNLNLLAQKIILEYLNKVN